MHAAGTLIGLAIGDAMGAPLEGCSPPVQLVVEMESGGVHGIKRGHFTDDTQQALAIACSLIICRGFSAADVMRRLVAGYEAQPWFYGPTSSKVFNLVREGIEPESAAIEVYNKNGGGRSNGSVMRGAPIGIFYGARRVRHVSLACARLTHADPVAGECSAFVNDMVSMLCRGVAREKAFNRALGRCELGEVREMLLEPGRFPLSPSLDALEATHCAVSVFLNALSFRDAIVTGINLGGDADTVGALCGALAGAFWGYDAIPSEWRAALYQIEEIFSLAGELAILADP